ncbi:MAG: hypothetical protein ABSG67_12910 [Thermoguttaceae bacterium]
MDFSRRCGRHAEHLGKGKASASFLGVEFRGSYLQNDTNLSVVTQSDWKEARYVSILDCEVGVYRTNCDRRVRAWAGYMVSSWMNAVKTAEFMSSVRLAGRFIFAVQNLRQFHKILLRVVKIEEHRAEFIAYQWLQPLLNSGRRGTRDCRRSRSRSIVHCCTHRLRQVNYNWFGIACSINYQWDRIYRTLAKRKCIHEKQFAES